MGCCVTFTLHACGGVELRACEGDGNLKESVEWSTKV